MTDLTLGGTVTLNGHPVPRIGYGMGSLQRSAERPEGRKAAIGLLHDVFDLGIRMLDTAQFYGNGLANELIRDSLGSVREELFIASKAGARPTPEGPYPMTAAQHPRELRDAVEQNLRSLGTDYLDLVYLRRMDTGTGLIATGDEVAPLEEQVAELLTLRQEGKVLGIGLSQVDKAQIEQAFDLGVEVQSVQNVYNLLETRDRPLLELCEARGTAWIPYFPLGGGFGHHPKVTDNPVVQEIAQSHGVTPSQVGQAWLLQVAPNTVVISGTSQRSHLEENAEAGNVRLSQEDMEQLNSLS